MIVIQTRNNSPGALRHGAKARAELRKLAPKPHRFTLDDVSGVYSNDFNYSYVVLFKQGVKVTVNETGSSRMDRHAMLIRAVEKANQGETEPCRTPQRPYSSTPSSAQASKTAILRTSRV